MVEVVVLTSQPSAEIPLQSEKPDAHEERPHCPATQLGDPFCAGQTTPQPPQFCTSVVVAASQPFAALPSQSVKPGEHAYAHVLAAHEATVLGRGAHARPQPPQWATVLVVLTSQPLAAFMSQLAKPAEHAATVHAPAAQPAVPLATAQVRPHIPHAVGVVLRLVSQPLAGFMSQSAKPVSHAYWHAPVTQVTVEWARIAPEVVLCI